MLPAIAFQPIRVRTGSQDTVGRLALFEGELIAVLVRLDDPVHDSVQRGGWFLETCFGPVASKQAPVFQDLDAAAAWIGKQLITSPGAASPKGNDDPIVGWDWAHLRLDRERSREREGPSVEW